MEVRREAKLVGIEGQAGSTQKIEGETIGGKWEEKVKRAFPAGGHRE